MKITDAEKEIISKLAHPLYTVEFLEHWVNRNDNPMINAPAALQAMGAKGYLDAVRQMSNADNLSDVVKKIFEEVDKLVYRYLNDCNYSGGDMIYDLAELEKKYIPENRTDIPPQP